MPSGEYNIEVQNLAAQPVALVRYRTSQAEFSAHMTQALQSVYGTLAQGNVEPDGPPFARYLDFGEDYIDVEVGFPVKEKFEQMGRIECQELPAGPAVATLHAGPYKDLGKAHEAVAKWAQENGRARSGPPFEIYLTNPAQVKDPSEHRTMIYLPVAG